MDYLCTPIVRNMECAGELFYIVRAYFTHRQFSFNWHIYMNVEDAPWYIVFQIPVIGGIYDMSARVLWHFMTRSYKCREHPLMRKYSLVKRHMVIPYNTIEVQYVVTGYLTCLSLFLFLSI